MKQTRAPAWRYKTGYPSQVFQTDAELEAAEADGWTDTPVLWPMVGSPPVVLPPLAPVSTPLTPPSEGGDRTPLRKGGGGVASNGNARLQSVAESPPPAPAPRETLKLKRKKS